MRYLFVIAVGLLFCGHANAQDNTLLDQLPVLELADVFVDGVEIVETLPELNTDGLSNIYFLASDAEAWEILPRPDALSTYYNLAAERLRNGNFELYVMPHDMAGPCPEPTPSFEFDPTTRHFILREQEISAPEPWRSWVLFYTEPPENMHLGNLCQMDMVGADLPDDMSDLIHSVEWQYVWDYGEGMHTPEYFIVPTSNSNDSGDHLFAIYTIAKDTWSESFPLALPGNWTFTDLAFADGVLYFRAMREGASVYYALDIASQTFTELFRTPYPQIVLSEQKEYIYYYMGYNDTHYQLYQYDLFAQREDVIAELPCADLTENCVELHLEQSNGYTDMDHRMFALTGPETEAGTHHFVIDITKSELLYSDLFPSQAFSSQWLDNNEPGLLIRFYRDIPELYALLVDLSADDPAATQVVIPFDVGDVSPDERRAVVYVASEEKDTKTIGVIDLQTLTYQPITLPIDTSLFGTWVYWQADGDLQVNLYSRDENITWYPDHPFILRTWVVRP